MKKNLSALFLLLLCTAATATHFKINTVHYTFKELKKPAYVYKPADAVLVHESMKKKLPFLPYHSIQVISNDVMDK